MSDKQKVYQGVRVKTTVKELLQRRRAALKTIKTQVSAGRVDIQELCVSTLQGNHGDTTNVAAFQGADVSISGTRNLQPHACSLQVQESSFDQRQFVDMSLLSGGGGETYSDHSASLLPHQPSFALLWSHEQQHSLNADYYNNPGMAPSPPDSVNLPSPVDHSSYSPQDSSFSSSSSSCYNSPTRMDGGSYQVFAPPDQQYHYQHCNDNLQQDCNFMPHCSWPAQQQDNFSAQEYAPYYGPIDYPYPPYPVEDNYFRRELTPMGSEMCYNVL